MQATKAPPAIRLDRNFEMPSVPMVLTKILELVDDNRGSAAQLEELILHDPSLSARILKLANSAYYSFRSEVRTISHAIALLGLNLVRSLAIGISIFESFTKGLRHEVVHINQLWMHSTGVGWMAKEIWVRRGGRSEGEFALLCGLLHDLGKVVYFKKDAPGYSRLFAKDKNEEDPDISTFEIERYGIDHAALGSMLAREWGLPQELAQVVEHHHDSSVSGIPLVAAVATADCLVKQAGIGFDGDRHIPENLVDLQLLLNMDQEEYRVLSEVAIAKRLEMKEFFHPGR